VVAREDGLFELHVRDNAVRRNMFSYAVREAVSSGDEAAMDMLSLLIIQKNSKEHHYRCYQGFNTLTVVVR